MSESAAVTRKYVPWREKHKAPFGFGSRCPEEISVDHAQSLLDGALPAPDNERELWNIKGEWCFVARPTRVEAGIWHGYPVPGAEVPEEVLQALEPGGVIDRRMRKRLRQQRVLPEGLVP